jgi:GNAT superfamily N-acetyltransferase
MEQQAPTTIDITLGDLNDKEFKRSVIQLARQDADPDFRFNQVAGMWRMLFNTLYPELMKQLEAQGCDRNDLKRQDQEWKAKVHLFDKRIIVAKCGEKLIGYCLWSFPVAKNRNCYCEYLYVDKDFRQRGIGEALMRTFFRWAETNNRTSKKITFDDGNDDLVRFYSKLGFKRGKEEPIHPKITDWYAEC